MKMESLKQFIKYGVIGLMSTVIYSAIMTFLAMQLPEWRNEAAILVYVSMVPFVYYFQERFSFGSRPRVITFGAYFVVQVVSIFASSSMLRSLVTMQPSVNFVVFIVVAGGASLISFLLVRFIKSVV